MPGGARRELRAACRELRDAANGGTKRMTITPAELYRRVASALPARASRRAALTMQFARTRTLLPHLCFAELEHDRCCVLHPTCLFAHGSRNALLEGP
jgi:hypothetical protein